VLTNSYYNPLTVGSRAVGKEDFLFFAEYGAQLVAAASDDYQFAVRC
jgi:hypothetical protein